MTASRFARALAATAIVAGLALGAAAAAETSIAAGESTSRSEAAPACSILRTWGITRWSKEPTASL